MSSKSSPPPEERSPDLELIASRELEPALLELLEDILNRGAALRVRVTGRSMAPFLRGGEVLTIRKTPCSALRRGDLIFFKTGCGHPAVHRILRKRRGRDGSVAFQTMGDARVVFDEPLRAEDVLGKVCAVDRFPVGGGAARWNLESPYWKAVGYLIAVAGLFRSKIYSALSRLA